MYEARVYRVQDDWKIVIKIDKDNQDAEVFRDQDGKEEKLLARDIKKYSLQKKESKLNVKSFAEGVNTVTGIARLVCDVLQLFGL